MGPGKEPHPLPLQHRALALTLETLQTLQSFVPKTQLSSPPPGSCHISHLQCLLALWVSSQRHPLTRPTPDGVRTALAHMCPPPGLWADGPLPALLSDPLCCVPSMGFSLLAPVGEPPSFSFVLVELSCPPERQEDDSQ